MAATCAVVASLSRRPVTGILSAPDSVLAYVPWTQAVAGSVAAFSSSLGCCWGPAVIAVAPAKM